MWSINGYQRHTARGVIPCDGQASRPEESGKLLGILHVKEIAMSSGHLGLWLACAFTFSRGEGGGGAGGGYSWEFLHGGAVPPGSPSPDPISDQTEMLFSTPVFRSGFNFHSDFQTRDRQKLVIIT